MGKYFSKEKWRHLGYTLSHPVDGYYWIRHREQGSVPLAILMVIIFSACFTTNRLLASFVVNDLDPRTVDSLRELGGVLLLYLLLCVGNWSITCLMNGEGRLKDIAIAVGYATVPMSIGLIAGTIFSQFVADTEVVFYWLVLAFGIGYGLIMVMIGIMQIHGYSFGITLGTLFLTFLAMLLMIFLALLIGNMLSLVTTFFRSVYTEIIFRT